MLNDIEQYFESKKEPTVDFNLNDGKFRLEGKSILEVAEKFYSPIYEDFKEYAKNPKDVTKFEFNMEYFNTSSSKWILKLFYLLDEINADGKRVIVSWNYDCDDEDMKEAGEDYNNMVDFNIDLIPQEV